MNRKIIICLLMSFLVTSVTYPQSFLKKLEKAAKSVTKTQDEEKKETTVKDSKKVSDTSKPVEKIEAPVAIFLPHITPETKTVLIPNNAHVQEDIVDGMFYVESNGKYAFFNKDGEPVTDYSLFKPGIFNNGACIVNIAYQKFAILYKDGTCLALPDNYKMVTDFVDGLALAYFSSGAGYMKSTYINTAGKEVYPNLVQTTKMISASSMVEGVQPVSEGLRAHYDQQTKTFGYIDEPGKIIIKPQFALAAPYSDGLAAVVTEDKGWNGQTWGFIDKTGTVVINGIEKYQPSNFSAGMAMVQTDAEKYHYIDKTGKKVSEDYFFASGFTDGYAFISTAQWNRTSTYIVVDTNFKPIRTVKRIPVNKQPEFYNGLAVLQSNTEPHVVYPNGSVLIMGIDSRNVFTGFKDHDLTYCRTVIDKEFKEGMMNRKGELELLFVKTTSDFAQGTPPDPKPIPRIPIKYTLTLTAQPSDGGTVKGGGKYETDQQVSLVATPSKDYKFIAWKNASQVISWESTFNYKTKAMDETLVAVFQKKLDIGNPPDKLPVCQNCVSPDPEVRTDTIIETPPVYTTDSIQLAKRYAGPFTLIVRDNCNPDIYNKIETTIVLELSKDKAISNLYGNSEYGVLATINDPNETHLLVLDTALPESKHSTCNVFFFPQRINGFVQENGQCYLIFSGGDYASGKLNWKMAGGYTDYFVMIAQTTFPNGDIIYGAANCLYRVAIHMLPDGGMKFGKLERFSYLTGWTNPEDPRLDEWGVHHAWFGSWGVQQEVPLFESHYNGAVLYPTTDETEIPWYPPTDWFINVSPEQGKTDITNRYKGLKTDVDSFWEQAK